MPDGEEVNNDEQTINLLSPEMNKEVNLKLTIGETMLVRQILDNSFNPRGFQMVEFCYNLMKKVNNAIVDEVGSEIAQESEVFVSDSDE